MLRRGSADARGAPCDGAHPLSSPPYSRSRTAGAARATHIDPAEVNSCWYRLVLVTVGQAAQAAQVGSASSSPPGGASASESSPVTSSSTATSTSPWIAVASPGVGRGEVAERAGDRDAVGVALQRARVDVGAARDRGRVAQVVGDLLDDAGDRALAGRLRVRDRRDREADGGQDGRAPGAEVLGADVGAGRVLQPAVDVRGLDVDPAAVRLVGQQLVAAAAALLQRGDVAGDGRVDDLLDAALGVLGGVVEEQDAVAARARGTSSSWPTRRSRWSPRSPRSRSGRSRGPAAGRPGQGRGLGRSRRGRGPPPPAGAGRGASGRTSTMSSNLAWSRRARQAEWYRYCLRPRWSIPVAWMWPPGYGQIQTSSQAGGIASSRMRARISSSVTRSPSGSR